MSSLDYLDLCRLCLVKDQVSVPIFDGEGDVRQIFLKIAACLPVKLTRDDKLPKKICNDCVYKVELFYEFWNTTSNSEKQLMQWLGEVDVNDKQTYVTAVINQDQSSDNRLDGNVMQQTNEHQNNMGMNIIETMSLEMPMMMSTDQTQMTINTTNNSNSQSIQALPGTSAQQKDGMGESEEDNSDDDMDRDEGLPVKEEIIQDTNRIIEPGAFLNVSLPCDEPGPSGLQQQKNADIPDMVIGGQTTESDNKAGKRKRGRPVSTTKTPDKIINIINAPARKIGRPKKTTIGAVSPQLKKEEDNLNTKITTRHSLKLARKNTKSSKKNQENLPLSPAKKRLMPTRNSIVTEKKKNIEKHSLYSDDDDDNDNNDDDDIWEPEKTKKQKIEEIVIEKKLQSIRKKKEKKIYHCSICDITFDLARKYKSHMERHYASKKFECEYCHKKFKNRSIIKAHLRNQHEQIRMFFCDQCPFQTKYPTTIATHKNRKHRTNNDPQFTCEVCKKTFFMKQDWETHIKNIHESGPQTCEICGLICPSRTSLLGHKNYRHKEKNFPCTMCKKKLTTAENLAAHIEQHRLTFICEICGMQFRKRNGLKKHEFVHLGKTFKCTHDGCEKKFTTVMTLRVHLLTHQGVKPYACNVCPKSFTQRSSLMHHWKRAHHDAPVPPPAVPLKSIVHG